MAKLGESKYSQDEVYEIMKSRGYELLDIYKNVRTPIVFRDLENYHYKINFNSFLCSLSINKTEFKRFNSGNPFTIINIENWLKINDKSFSLVSKEYINCGEKLFFKCKFCLRNFDITWENIYAGQNCPFCANNGKRLSERNSLVNNFPNLVEEWDCERNKNINIEKISLGNRIKVWWICSKCKYNYFSTVSSRTVAGEGCPNCAGRVLTDKNRLSTLCPDLILDWDYSKNEKNPEEYFYASNKKVHWVCSKCGYKWKASICNRSKGRGCLNCNKSLGENRIKKYLELNNLEHVLQFKIPECRYKYVLPFDFGVYIKERLILIEYQGGQHYKSVDRFGGEEGFEKRLLLDKIKKDYCMNNNILFLEIPYWDFDNIELILDGVFNFIRNL